MDQHQRFFPLIEKKEKNSYQKIGSHARKEKMSGSIFKEFSHFFRFFWKTPTQKKSIVFYAEHSGYYPYFHGTIQQLTHTDKTPICYVTSDHSDPILSTNNPFITPFYLKKLLPLFMILVNTKVFVMTLTDLHQFHLRRSINPVHYLYLFHALVSTHMMYREGAFDHYDSIICCGPHQVDEIRKREKQEGLNQKKLINGGYYRLEQIWQQHQNLVKNAPKQKTILIAPSWGEHNIVKTCGKKLVQQILEQTEYHVILRPHPETKKQSPELLQEYKTLFENNSRFTLEESIATNNSLLQANLLITDLSGIALEYAFGTQKPVLFIDLPYKIKNPNFKKLEFEPLELAIRSEIGAIVAPEQIDSVVDTINQLIQNQTYYETKITNLRNKHVYEFGNSSHVTANYIRELCS